MHHNQTLHTSQGIVNYKILTVTRPQSLELQCLLKVKEDLSTDISSCYINYQINAWIDNNAVLIVNDSIVIYRKNGTILILISLKTLFFVC